MATSSRVTVNSEARAGVAGVSCSNRSISVTVSLIARRKVPVSSAASARWVLPAAQVRLIVWCKACQHQVEPDSAEMATRCGAGTSVLDWRERLVYFRCKSGRSIW